MTVMQEWIERLRETLIYLLFVIPAKSLPSTRSGAGIHPYQQDGPPPTRDLQQQATRSLRYHFDDDGSLVLKARLPAEVGALVIKALQAAVGEMSVSDVPAGTSEERPSFAARRADALGLLAQGYLENGSAAMNGGDRNLITVHVSAETLRHKTAGCCKIEEGPAISAETARRLSCDASVVALIEDEDGEPLNVGRRTRDGAFRFVQPNGQAFDSVTKDHVQPFTDWTILPAMHAERGIAIDARTAATRWRGESCDYGLGVQVLLQHAKRRDVRSGWNAAAEQ